MEALQRLLVDGVDAGTSGGALGGPQGLENLFLIQTQCECERARVLALYRCFLRSPKRTLQMGEIALAPTAEKACYCHCCMNEACHVDELVSAWQRQDRIIAPDVTGKTPAEFELVLKLTVPWARSRVESGLAVMILRCSGFDQRNVSRDSRHPGYGGQPRAR